MQEQARLRAEAEMAAEMKALTEAIESKRDAIPAEPGLDALKSGVALRWGTQNSSVCFAHVRLSVDAHKCGAWLL